MSLKDLLAANRIRNHATSKQELDGLCALVERDLQDADIPNLSADPRYATAYNAVLQLCKMALACGGYRVGASLGRHQTTFEASSLLLSPFGRAYTTYFDTCRHKRNRLEYDSAHVVTETETREFVKKAHEFRRLVEEWIGREYPQL